MNDVGKYIGSVIGNNINQLNNIAGVDSNPSNRFTNAQSQAFSLEVAKQLMNFMTSINESQASQGGGKESQKQESRGMTEASKDIQHHKAQYDDPIASLSERLEGIVETLGNNHASNHSKEHAVNNLSDIMNGLFDRSSSQDEPSDLFSLAKAASQSLGNSLMTGLSKLLG